MIELGAGITPGNVVVRPYANDHVELSFIGTGDRLRLINFLAPYSTDTEAARYRFNEVRFADSTVWDSATIKAMALAGTAGADRRDGGEYIADVLDGGDGNDLLRGLGGNDTLNGGAGNDTIEASTGNDILDGGAGNDLLLGDTGNDIIRFGRGSGQDAVDMNDSTVGRIDTVELTGTIAPSEITLRRSGDHLQIYLNNSGELLTVNYHFSGADPNNQYRVDRITFLSNGTIWNYADIQSRTLAALAPITLNGTAGNDTLTGGVFNESLYGAAGNDTLTGGMGDDYLEGGTGNDVYRFAPGWGQDRIAAYDTTVGKLDVIQFEAGIAPGDIRVTNVSGLLVLERIGTGDRIQVERHFAWDASNSSERIEEVRFDDATVWNLATLASKALAGNDTDQTIYGLPSANDAIDGGRGDDTLYGQDGGDTLTGGEGYDALYGEAGNDTLIGGLGDDFLSGGQGSDTYRFAPGWGQDRIDAYDTSVGKTDVIQFETGILPGDISVSRSGAFLVLERTGTGDKITVERQFPDYTSYTDERIEEVRFANGTIWNVATLRTMALAGTAAPQTLYGFIDVADVLDGAGGNDKIYGQHGNDTLTGGTGDDSLYGEWDNDTLTGGIGDDYLIGGQGSDTYVFDAGWGRDYIENDYQVGDTDTLRFDAAVRPGELTFESNSDWHMIVSRSGSNDRITVYRHFLDSQNYQVTTVAFSDGTSYDVKNGMVRGTPGSDTLTAGATSKILLGYGGNDTLTGGAGGDWLDGGWGADQMTGGAGNDLYIVDVASDVVVEAAAGGTDSVNSIIDYVLGTNLENLHLIGVDPISGTGNTLANRITGNAANNLIDGKAGNDTMLGAAGDDTYIVDSTSDVVTEAANEGTDTIQSSVTYTLGAHVEKLTLTGAAAINATGNTLNNVLTGNGANNILNGGAGIDTLIGGVGNDVYVVDSTTDVITENASEGTDTVQSSVTYSIAAAANLENVTLTGASAINATGNAGNNVLTGNTANNTLSGGAGIDTLIGGTGNDIYVVDSTTDVITENASAGTDTVQSSVTYSIAAAANLENVTLTGASAINATGNAGNNMLTGNSGANTLNGGDGNDTLTGGSGNDAMVGGLGNDTYVVDAAGDVVTEAASAGTDLVQSAVTYTLAANVENLTLTGTGAINGTGNVLNNVLTGNSGVNTLNGGDGNDTLSGAAGNDTMVGGLGNDTYVVDTTGDVVTEAASAGTDLVQSGVTLTLAANVEDLTLTGTSAINGTGNVLNNVLTGNSGVNTLNGSDGNDTLNGAAGNDTMLGGIGSDILIGGTGNDTMTGGTGSDTFDYNAITEGLDSITDFVRGLGADKLDIRDVLVGYTPGTSNINNFVQLSGTSSTTFAVNADGIGTDFTSLATLQGMAYTSTLLNELVAQGNLIAA